MGFAVFLALLSVAAFGLGYHLMIQAPVTDLTPGLQAGKVLMTAGAVTLSSTAAVFSPQLSSLQSGCSRNMAWMLVVVTIITFLSLGVALPANCHSTHAADPSHSTLAHDAVGNLFLGLAAVTTGFVLGQDKVSNAFSGMGIWMLVIFLFGAGSIITAAVPVDGSVYTYQWGNVSLEMAGAVLACAIGKTLFGGASSNFLSAAPSYKILFLILFLGCGVGGGYMGFALTDPGWGALSSVLLCGSGACLAAVAEDLITNDDSGDVAKPKTARNSTPARKSHNSGSYHTPLPFYDNDSVFRAHNSDSGSVPFEEFRGRYAAYKAALDSSATDLSYKAYKQKQKERWEIATTAASASGMAEVGATQPRCLASSGTTAELVSGSTLFLLAQLLILPLFVIGYFLIRRIQAITAKRARLRALDELELVEIVIECHRMGDTRETERVRLGELF